MLWRGKCPANQSRLQEKQFVSSGQLPSRKARYRKLQLLEPRFCLKLRKKAFGLWRQQNTIRLRTGAYREYVLTGDGWSHPTKTRFFLGASASYMYETTSWFKIQVTLLTDVLLPDDYDEIWSYWAIEPSVYFVFYKNIYAGLTATMGSFLFFDPRADMDKAGIRFGCFF